VSQLCNSEWDSKFENMEPAAESDNTEIVPDVDIEKERQELEAKIKEDERVFVIFISKLFFKQFTIIIH
jgi:hypothetical protein